MKTRFIGDAHGKFKQYRDLLTAYPTIQLGDMGIGFPDIFYEEKEGRYEEVLEEDLKSNLHRFIRGNHDNPTACKSLDNWIPDGHVEDLGSHLAIFIGGATSIDRYNRIENISWWKEENLDYRGQNYVVEQYKKYRPDIVVSHTLPESLIGDLLGKHSYANCPTEKLLDFLWNEHKPRYWICGHWHKSVKEKINNCQFFVLDELETLDLDL